MKKTSLILLTCLLFGCKEKPAPVPVVDGQMFVTLNNRETIKLAGVDVYVCQSEGFWSSITPKIATHREVIKKLDQEAHEARLEAIRNDLPSKTRIALEKKREASDARQFYFLQENKWPGVISMVKTDADGRFTVQCPTNALLVACTSRRVGEADEAYFWAVKPQSKLLMENSNMHILLP